MSKVAPPTGGFMHISNSRPAQLQAARPKHWRRTAAGLVKIPASRHAWRNAFCSRADGSGARPTPLPMTQCLGLASRFESRWSQCMREGSFSCAWFADIIYRLNNLPSCSGCGGANFSHRGQDSPVSTECPPAEGVIL